MVRIQENTDQKKLRIWTIFTQCRHKLIDKEKGKRGLGFTNFTIQNKTGISGELKQAFKYLKALV